MQKQVPLSNQLLASQADGDLLLAALRHYLSGHLSLHSGGMKQEAPSPWLRPLYNNGIENPGLKKETFPFRPVKTGSSPVASAKEPLTSVDGMCLHKEWFYFLFHQVLVLQTCNIPQWWDIKLRHIFPQLPVRCVFFFFFHYSFLLEPNWECSCSSTAHCLRNEWGSKNVLHGSAVTLNAVR